MDMVRVTPRKAAQRNAQFHAISGPPVEEFVEMPPRRPVHYALIAVLGDCDIGTRLTLGDQVRFSAAA
jgi:hypothetical protein